MFNKLCRHYTFRAFRNRTFYNFCGCKSLFCADARLKYGGSNTGCNLGNFSHAMANPISSLVKKQSILPFSGGIHGNRCNKSTNLPRKNPCGVAKLQQLYICQIIINLRRPEVFNPYNLARIKLQPQP